MKRTMVKILRIRQKLKKQADSHLQHIQYTLEEHKLLHQKIHEQICQKISSAQELGHYNNLGDYLNGHHTFLRKAESKALQESIERHQATKQAEKILDKLHQQEQIRQEKIDDESADTWLRNKRGFT